MSCPLERTYKLEVVIRNTISGAEQAITCDSLAGGSIKHAWLMEQIKWKAKLPNRWLRVDDYVTLSIGGVEKTVNDQDLPRYKFEKVDRIVLNIYEVR